MFWNNVEDEKGLSNDETQNNAILPKNRNSMKLVCPCISLPTLRDITETEGSVISHTGNITIVVLFDSY